MSNRSSKAGHVPQRTCLICRKKAEKRKLMRFVLFDSEIVFDRNGVLGKRGYYVCNINNCLLKLDKWVSRMIKKNRSSNGR